MKLIGPIILLVLIVSFIPTPIAQAQNDWVIDGDKVYIDDSNAYLSTTPATLGSSGWVEFELRTKSFSGAIDVVWGFPFGQGIEPSKPQRWVTNAAHEVHTWVPAEKQYEQIFTDITDWEVLELGSATPDLGNTNNDHLVRLEIEGWGDIVVAFNSYDQHSETSATFYGNYDGWEDQITYEYYDDWVDWNVSLQKVYYSYAGVEEWRVAQVNADIVAGVTYKVRCWMELPFTGLDRFYGKYVWAVKPSSETIQEARTNGHLYLLDPWYDANWSYRYTITFNNTASAVNLTNFPVSFLITDKWFDWTHAQNAGQDIRFTDEANVTCPYEIELWNDNVTAAVHVNVTQIDAGSSTDLIYMYCGNAGASDGQDVKNVWDDNYVGVWHLSEAAGTIGDSTKYGSNSTVEQDLAYGLAGKIGNCIALDGNDYVKFGDNANLEFTIAGFTLEAITYMDDVSDDDQNLLTKSDALPNIEYLLQVEDNGFARTLISEDGTGWDGNLNGSGIGGGQFQDDTWYQIAVTWDHANIKHWANGAAMNPNPSTAYSDGINTSNSEFLLGANSALSHYMTGYLDEARASKIARSDDWVEATYLCFFHKFCTFSAVESNDPPTVTSSATTGVTNVQATFNGNITNVIGGNATLRGFQWGLATGNYSVGNWTETGDFGVGAFSHTNTTLTQGTQYFWRAFAFNDKGQGYSGELNFTTLNDLPLPPTNFTATITGPNEVTITWDKGLYAVNTTIRGQSGTAPTSLTGGYLLYDSTGNSTTFNAYTLDTTTEGFSGWSRNLLGNSTTYATTSIGGAGMNNLVMFLVFPGILGMVLFCLAVVPRRKNLALSSAAFLIWLAIFFWWFTGGALTDLGFPEDVTVYLVYVPLLMAFIVMGEFMARANQVEIRRKMGRNEWTEWGPPPSDNISVQAKYRKMLREKLR